MNAITRGILTFVTAVATFYFTFWIGGALFLGGGLSGPAIWIVSIVLAVGLAAFAAGYVWKRSLASGGLATSMLAGAFVTGAIGFCIGFFGPLIFTPGANQGPLLGLFITGPAGFVLGALGGWVRWAARRARATSPSSIAAEPNAPAAVCESNPKR